MKFTVTWSNRANSQLARWWLPGGDWRAVAEAANRLDARLQVDAHHAGESRPNDRRIMHEPPLGIIFSVNLDDQKVIVLDVWKYEKRR